MRVRALEDIYKVLGSYSEAVQSTQVLPWERQASQEDVGNLLERMRLSLVAQHKKSPSLSELLDIAENEKLWPSLSKSETTPPVQEVRLLPYTT